MFGRVRGSKIFILFTGARGRYAGDGGGSKVGAGVIVDCCKYVCMVAGGTTRSDLGLSGGSSP